MPPSFFSPESYDMCVHIAKAEHTAQRSGCRSKPANVHSDAQAAGSYCLKPSANSELICRMGGPWLDTVKLAPDPPKSVIREVAACARSPLNSILRSLVPTDASDQERCDMRADG